VAALVTPDILSKYQRIFNFLLRILRGEHPSTKMRVLLLMSFNAVETVARGLFNSVIKGSDLFTGYPESLGLLHRFRFHTHAFVSTLIAYTFDTAIGTHFDGFMSKVQEIAAQHALRISQRHLSRDNARRDASNEAPGSMRIYVDDDAKPLADVFDIMDEHSIVLDKILGSCMLRTQQRAISDVLEDILSIVLQLGSLVRDLRRGAFTNEDAARQLGKLHHNFERKMTTFVSVYNHSFVYYPCRLHLFQTPLLICMPARQRC